MNRKAFLVIIAFLLCFALCVPALAEGYSRLEDFAGLLSEDERAVILAQLDDISERQGMDVVIVTVASLDGKTATEYADDYFDYNGFGQGADRNGILFLISMEDRDWAISTRGDAIAAFTDAGQAHITDEMVPMLSEGEYADAFVCFANYCDDYITQANAGEPYDVDNMPKEKLDTIWIPLSLAIGMAVALIVCLIMKSQLKSVRSQPEAMSYVINDSVSFTEQSDVFLYKTLTKTKIQKAESGSGGSSTHTSSSDATHGGSSGKF